MVNSMPRDAVLSRFVIRCGGGRIPRRTSPIRIDRSSPSTFSATCPARRPCHHLVIPNRPRTTRRSAQGPLRTQTPCVPSSRLPLHAFLSVLASRVPHAVLVEPVLLADPILGVISLVLLQDRVRISDGGPAPRHCKVGQAIVNR